MKIYQPVEMNACARLPTYSGGLCSLKERATQQVRDRVTHNNEIDGYDDEQRFVPDHWDGTRSTFIDGLDVKDSESWAIIEHEPGTIHNPADWIDIEHIIG